MVTSNVYFKTSEANDHTVESSQRFVKSIGI